MKKMTVACTMALMAFVFSNCEKNATKNNGGSSTTIPRGALGQGNFSLWGTCNGHPYNIAGTTNDLHPHHRAGLGTIYLPIMQIAFFSAQFFSYYASARKSFRALFLA